MTNLICACCGKYTKGKQWWNQDKGYGLCPECGDWILSRGETVEEMEFTYGKRGIYWDLKQGGN